MNPIGRALGRSWVGILLLCCGGCAVHPFLDSSGKAAGAATAASLMPPPATTSVAPTPTSAISTNPAPTVPLAYQPPPNVSLTDVVAVKNSLQKSGYSYAEADLMAKAWLNAWEQTAEPEAIRSPALDRLAADDADSEGIPLDPADGSDRALSPAAPRLAGTRAPKPTHLPESPRSQYPTSSPRPKKESSLPRIRNRSELDAIAADRTNPRRPSIGMAVESGDTRTTALSSEGPSMHGDPYSWLVPMREAAEQLRTQLDDPELPSELRSKYEVMLSLLLLAEEDPEQAVSALETFDDEELEFWRQSVLGLGTLLDTEGFPRRQDRVERATDFLRQGVHSLSTLGRLQVRNLALCTKINGYGDFDECGPTDIKPDAPLLLYVEVENYLAEPLTSGRAQTNWIADAKRRNESSAGGTKYSTEFHGRYDIYDAKQNRVLSAKELPVARDECRNVRRDYFIPYQIYLPKTLTPGAYTLDLTIEDKKSGKEGNAVLDFQVR